MTGTTPALRDETARLAAMTAHDRSVLVEAGAGSGKTAVMAGRLALLLAGGTDPQGSLEVVAELQIMASDDAPAPDVAISIQGGRERGLVIHKLFEEVLTGETADDLSTLTARAAELVRAIGREPGTDAMSGLSADEMASTVAKTLQLSEIAVLRPKLLAELPVYGLSEDDGVDLATFGVVDALCVGEDGRPELVIDWKSDVRPSAAASDHYRSQVRRYLEVTGIPKGLVVFVTTGDVLTVSAPVLTLSKART